MVAYELMFLTSVRNPPTITAEFLKRCVKFVNDNRGVVTALESLGRRATAYRIKKDTEVHDDADFFILRADCAPEVINELSGYITKDVRCLRHVVTKDKSFKLPKLKPYWDAVKREKKRVERERIRDLYVPEEGLRLFAQADELSRARSDAPHRHHRTGVFDKYEPDTFDPDAPQGPIGDRPEGTGYTLNTRLDNLKRGVAPNDQVGTPTEDKQ